MRILHLSTNDRWGGGEQQIVYLTTELKSAAEQLVVCVDGAPLSGRLAVPCLEFERGLLFPLRWAWKIRSLLRQYDIVHAHDSKAFSVALFASFFSVRKAPQIVVHRRFADSRRKGFWSRFKYNQPLVRKIICISSYVHAETLKDVNDPQRLAVVHSGVDLSRFATAPKHLGLRVFFDFPPDCRIIASIGALTAQKHFDSFIDMAAILHHGSLPNLRFLIVGKGEKEAELAASIDRLGLGGIVRLAGFISDIPALLAETDILVSTAVNEAFGNIIMEAFCSGVPVVAARSGGVMDLVIDQETGLLAEPKSPQSFAIAVRRLAESPEGAQRLAQAARVHVAQFAVPSMSAAILNIYTDILRAKRE